MTPDRMEEMLVEYKISRDDLAKMSGTSRPTVARFLQGDASLTMARFRVLQGFMKLIELAGEAGKLPVPRRRGTANEIRVKEIKAILREFVPGKPKADVEEPADEE